MLLTPQQIEELRQIIRDATAAVAISTTGMEATPEQLARLVDQGYLRQEDIRDITLDAFELGRLLEKLPGAAQMGYREFRDYLKHNPVEMSDAERLAYGIARDRAGQFCVGLGTRASGEVGTEVVQLDEQLASAWRNGIQDESSWKGARRDAVNNLTTRLRQMSEDWARDWGRIASTESQMAYQQGFLEATVRRHGLGELLAKMPESNACDDCKRLYLDEDGKPEAHPASWWADNGVNNVGRKRAEWLPVLGAMHPWCQCQLVRVPRGMVFDDDGDLVPESSIAEKSLRKAQQLAFGGWSPAPRSKKGALRRRHGGDWAYKYPEVSDPGKARTGDLAQAMPTAGTIEPYDAGRPWSVIGQKVDGAEAAAGIAKGIASGDRERMIVITVDKDRRPINVHCAHVGTFTGVEVHPLQIFKPSLMFDGAGIYLAHNHPSGEVSPSEADRRLTARMQKVGSGIGIPVLGHVVVSRSEDDRATVYQEVITHEAGRVSDLTPETGTIPEIEFRVRSVSHGTAIRGSSGVAEYLAKLDRRFGQQAMMLLDSKNRIVATHLGPIDNRKMLELAVAHGAIGMITASDAEQTFTRSSAEAVGLQLLDHIRYTSPSDWRSYADNKILKGKPATPGEIHHWTTGPHQKQADGGWEPVDEGKQQHRDRVEELKGTIRIGGEYQIEGGHGLVMGDPSEPGKVRLQKFDARGFWGHQTYDNLDALIEDVALRHPLVKPSPGALDRLSGTPEWAEGTASAQVIQAINTLGYHRHQEATEKVNRYWSTHGAIKTAAALEGANLRDGKLPPAFDAEPVAKSRKLHYRTIYAGLPISVENRRGSVRHWYDRATDTEGTTKLKRPYGYIRMTEGADGDHLDVFLGPDEQAKLVYIIHQKRPPEFTEEDEDKVMLGWPDLASAKRDYLRHYDDPRFFGGVTTIPIEKFRANCLEGKYRRGEMIKAQQIYLGPRGGRWSDAAHTQSYQEGQPKQRPRLHERFGPSGAPAPGERGHRDPVVRPAGAWDGEEPADLALDMITAARKVWEDVDYGMIAKLGDVPAVDGEPAEWMGFAYSDLPDLLYVPFKDGQGQPYTDEQRLMIAERLVDIAGETYVHAAQGDTGIELPPVKHRKEWMQDWNPERYRREMTIPTWVAAAILADSMDREHRDLRLVNVAKDEAAKFIEAHHATLPYLNPRGLMYALGVKRGGRLVAVATAGSQTGRALRGLDPRNIVELTRVASDGTTRNAASMLTARLLDLLERSKRGDPTKPALFITYQLAGERGDTYRALADKGLRPVEYIRGDRPHGTRAGSGPESLAGVDKIRWEAGPAAGPADWSLLEESEQLPLVKAEQGSFRGFGAPAGGWMPIQHPRGGRRGYYRVEGGKRVYHYPDFPSGRQVGQAGEEVASTVEVFVNVSAGAEHKRFVSQELGDYEWLRNRLGKLGQRGVGVQVTAGDILHIRKTPEALERWRNTFVEAARTQGMRLMIDSGEAGRKRRNGPPIDFDQVFAAYETMADRMPPGTLQVVAPDVIKDPETTAKLREQYADRVRALIARGVDVIVPIQARESRSIVKDYLRVKAAFGDEVIIAFPAAIDPVPMREILPAMISIYRQGQTPKVHFLGLGDPKETAGRTVQLVAAHYFAGRAPLARVWELVRTPESAQAALDRVKAWNELAQLTVDPRFDERVRRWAHKRGLLTADQAAAPMWGVVESDRGLGEAHDQAWQAFLEAHREEFDQTIISLSNHWRRQARRLVQGDSKTVSSVQQYGKRHDPVTGTQVPSTREVSTAYPKVEHFPEIIDEYLVAREMQTEARVSGKDEPWGELEKLRPLAKAADATIVQISHRTPIGTMGNWGKPARTAGENAYAPGMPPDHPASIERRRKRKKRGRTKPPEEKQARMRALTSRYQDWARPFPVQGRYSGDRRTEEHREIFDQKIEEKAKRLDAGRLTINPKALRP